MMDPGEQFPQPCMHCYARIVKVGFEWVDLAFANIYCIDGDSRITHRPLPDIPKPVKAE